MLHQLLPGGGRSWDSSLCFCWLSITLVGDSSLLLGGDGSSGQHWLLPRWEGQEGLSTTPQMASTEEGLFYCLAVVKGLTPLGLFWHRPIAGMGKGTLLLPGRCQALHVVPHWHMGMEVSLSLVGTSSQWAFTDATVVRSVGCPVVAWQVKCRLPTQPFLVGVGPKFVCFCDICLGTIALV